MLIRKDFLLPSIRSSILLSPASKFREISSILLSVATKNSSVVIFLSATPLSFKYDCKDLVISIGPQIKHWSKSSRLIRFLSLKKAILSCVILPFRNSVLWISLEKKLKTINLSRYLSFKSCISVLYIISANVLFEYKSVILDLLFFLSVDFKMDIIGVIPDPAAISKR